MEFPMHWLIIAVIVLILFGGRKIPELMRGMRRNPLQAKSRRTKSHSPNQTKNFSIHRAASSRLFFTILRA